MFKDESSNQSMLRAFLAIITTGSVCATVEPRSWMSDMTRADSRFGKLSIEDLVLPGSHDTLSYELSDELTELPVTPPAVGSLVRSFAVTQTINITQQLDAGIRFVDLRVMKVPDGEWYGTHTVRTEKPALFYVREIVQWLSRSPGEFLVVFVSRHGNECLTGHDQYPHVSAAEKQGFWRELTSLVGRFALPASYLKLGFEDLRLLRRSGMFLAVSDFAMMTNNSSFAIDACVFLNNTGGGGRPSRIQYETDMAYIRDMMSPTRGPRYYLRSIASAASREEVIARLIVNTSIPAKWRALAYSDCVHSYGLPMQSSFCAADLPSLGAFCNYYNRRVLLRYLNSGAHPNAFYADMITVGGGFKVSGESDFDYFGLIAVMNVNTLCATGCSAELISFAASRQAAWSVRWTNSSKLGLTSVSPQSWS